MLLIDETITNFTDKLASNAPTPGGGGTAALVGALAAALASMMANLTIGKKKFADLEPAMKILAGELDIARAEMLKLVDEDAKAYGMIVSCYAMPKNTWQEEDLRREQLAKAAQYAALIPLRIAEHCAKVADLTYKVTELGNPGLLTDAACGAILAYASLECAGLNMNINLPLTHNKEFSDDCQERYERARMTVQIAKQKVLGFCHDKGIV